MVVYADNLRTVEDVAGGLLIRGYPELHRETTSQKQNKIKGNKNKSFPETVKRKLLGWEDSSASNRVSHASLKSKVFISRTHIKSQCRVGKLPLFTRSCITWESS